MEPTYKNTRDYLEILLEKNIYHFDRTQKSLILTAMIQEGDERTAEKIWSGFTREQTEYLLSFLKDLTALNVILMKSHLIDKMYNNISEEIEDIIDEIIVEKEGHLMGESEENKFFDDAERARDMAQESANRSSD